MADWVIRVQREAEEWNLPAQDTRKINSDGRRRRALDEVPVGSLVMQQVARQSQSRHQRRGVCPFWTGRLRLEGKAQRWR